MVIESTTILLCRYCRNPMQVAECIKDDKGKILAQRYVCHCNGALFQQTIHSGDKTQETT